MRTPHRPRSPRPWASATERTPFGAEDLVFDPSYRDSDPATRRPSWKERVARHPLFANRYGSVEPPQRPPLGHQTTSAIRESEARPAFSPEGDVSAITSRPTPPPQISSHHSGKFQRLLDVADIIPALAFSPRWEHVRTALRVAAASFCALVVLSFGFFVVRAATAFPSQRLAAASSPSNSSPQHAKSTTGTTRTSTKSSTARSRTQPVATPSTNTKHGAPVNAIDIPSDYMSQYREAANRCDLRWDTLAAIGQVESNHGRSTAPGVHSGTNEAGAAGPMQFLPATWDTYRVDGNRDGRTDIYNPADAIHSAAEFLCRNGATRNNNSRALHAYNPDAQYVKTVQNVAESLRSTAYVFPLPLEYAESNYLSNRHHDYPAIDIATLVNTPVYAARGGTATRIDDRVCGRGVRIDTTDGETYTYCHATSVRVSSGANVETGQLIMHTGGAPGTTGAGSSTGPHLHLRIEVNDTPVCPVSLLRSWAGGDSASPARAPRTGCTD